MFSWIYCYGILSASPNYHACNFITLQIGEKKLERSCKLLSSDDYIIYHYYHFYSHNNYRKSIFFWNNISNNLSITRSRSRCCITLYLLQGCSLLFCQHFFNKSLLLLQRQGTKHRSKYAFDCWKIRDVRLLIASKLKKDINLKEIKLSQRCKHLFDIQ